MNSLKTLFSKTLSSLMGLCFPAEFEAWPPQRAHGQSVQYAFTNFAGMPGGPGNVDGIGSEARFRFRQFRRLGQSPWSLTLRSVTTWVSGLSSTTK